MNDLHPVTLCDPIDDLFEHVDGFILLQTFLLINSGSKVSAIAILQDHELEVGALEGFIAFDDVGGVEEHHYAGLGLGQAQLYLL